jgi:hypothetical protein
MEFESNLEFVKYLYDEYKQDVPLTCICAHYTEDVIWIYGQEEIIKNVPLIGKFFGHKGMIEFLTLKNKLINVNTWKRISYEEISIEEVKVELDCEYELISNPLSLPPLRMKEVHFHKVKDFQSKKVLMKFDLNLFVKFMNK